MVERAMTSAEVLEFVEDPHVATMVTLTEDGSPHAAPAWYRFYNDTIYIVTEESSVEVENLRRDPRLAVCIANDSSPAKYVVMEADAQVTTEYAREWTYEMYHRYQGEERGARSAEDRLSRLQMLVIVARPRKTMSWVSESGHEHLFVESRGEALAVGKAAVSSETRDEAEAGTEVGVGLAETGGSIDEEVARSGPEAVAEQGATVDEAIGQVGELDTELLLGLHRDLETQKRTLYGYGQRVDGMRRHVQSLRIMVLVAYGLSAAALIVAILVIILS